MHQTLGDVEGFGPVGHLAQDGELVAAEASQGVHRPQGAAQPLGGRLEQPVTGLVPQAVVDELEAVEVEEHERHAVVVALGPAEGHLEAVHEQHPVGQAGELVVHGGVGQALSQLPAFGDVVDLADDVEGIAVLVAHAAGADVHPHVVAVGVDVALLQGVALDVADDEGVVLDGVGLPVVGVGDLADRHAHEVLRGVPRIWP